MGQKQTARGTAATPAIPAVAVSGAYKMPFSGGNIGPVREVDNLTETDSSRDRGTAYVTNGGVEGSPEFYVRGGSIGFWLNAVLGTDTAGGTLPNYTHTFTPADALNYYTIWRSMGNTLWEAYRDCKVGSLAFSVEAGGALSATVGIQGLQASRLTTDPSVAPAIPLVGSGTALDDAVFTYNDRPAAGIVTLGGSATALVRSFDLSIENNLTRQQTDGLVPYDVVEGTREISLGFDLIFESLDEYNKFHYGGAAGVAIAPGIFTTSAAFTFNKGTNNELSFTLPRIAYEEFSIEPNPGGDPVVASVRAMGQRGATPVISVALKNQVAIYN
jgi:hypothetical protein